MSIRIIARQTKLLSLLLAASLVVWAASPGQANLIVNGDFELPAAGKITSGWDPVPAGWPGGSAPAGSDVPGWDSAGFAPLAGTTDSGIETTGNDLPGSTYSAFSHSSDADLNNPGGGIRAHQLTSHVIQAGDQFALSLYARPLYTFLPGFAGPANATLHWIMYADDGTDPFAPFDPSMTIDEGYFDLGLAINNDGAEAYQLHSTGPISAAGFAGKLVGVSIFNTSGGWYPGDPAGAAVAAPGNSWVGFDNVDLSLAVPEPASMALVLLGSVGLLGFGRQR